MKTLTFVAIAALAIGSHGKLCGKTGYDSQDAYYYDDSGEQGNYQTCSKLCSADKECKSFSFNQDTCMMFKEALKKNFEQDDSSQDIFYDRECIGTTTSRSMTADKTTLITSTRTSSSFASSTTTAVVIPAQCSNVATAKIINEFSWFNSTHNCDCAASHPDVGDGTGCLDETGQWCDPNKDKNCTHCGIGVCMTGLPPQPVGYGPPDVVKFGFKDGLLCQQANPQGFKPFEVGEGYMQCGPGRNPSMTFNANSEAEKSKGAVSYTEIIACGPDSNGNYANYYAYYKATFDIDCRHDTGRNATCTTPQSEIRMPLISFSTT